MAKNPSACENAVTAPEPFPVGDAMRPSSSLTSETRTHRYARGNGVRRFDRQSCPRANERRDESVECEDRRCREPRQNDQRCLPDHRKTQRLARLERDAMNENAWAA